TVLDTRRIARRKCQNHFHYTNQTNAGRFLYGTCRKGPRTGRSDRGHWKMSSVMIVARNTFREAVRDRVLYNLVFFALLMIASAVIVGQISMDIESIVMVSLGLSAISLIG